MDLGDRRGLPALDRGGPVHAAFLKPVASMRAADPFVLGRKGAHESQDRTHRLAVALGGFLVGFDAAVISGAVPFIRDYFDLGGSAGSLKLGWAVSCLGWGAMAGNLAAGPLSDRFGRRSVLLLTAVLFLASSLTAALVHQLSRCSSRRVSAAVLRSERPFSRHRSTSRRSPRPAAAAASSL